MTALEFQYELTGLQGSLMRFAYTLTTNHDDSKDLVQETFLKALQHCDKFVHESNFKAWTFTIMKNTFINNYRRSQRYNYFNDQTKEGYQLNNKTASVSDNPDSVYSTKEIEKTFERLNEDSKLPLKMYYEGYKYKEIAEKLNLNLGTVKSRIFFTRKKLMKQLNS